MPQWNYMFHGTVEWIHWQIAYYSGDVSAFPINVVPIRIDNPKLRNKIAKFARI